MLTTSQLGNLGEAKATTKFIQHGFDIYTQFSGANLFDFIAYRGGKLYKVEVKTTNVSPRYGGYTVGLIGTAYGPDRTIIHKPLNKSIDILIVYIHPLDTLCFIDPKKIESWRTITLRKEPSSQGKYNQWIIRDHADLEELLRRL